MDFCEPEIAKRLVLEIVDIFVMLGELAEDNFGMECSASQATEFDHDYGSRNNTLPGACSSTAGNFECRSMKVHLARNKDSFVSEVKLNFVNQD